MQEKKKKKKKNSLQKTQQSSSSKSPLSLSLSLALNLWFCAMQWKPHKGYRPECIYSFYLGSCIVFFYAVRYIMQIFRWCMKSKKRRFFKLGLIKYIKNIILFIKLNWNYNENRPNLIHFTIIQPIPCRMTKKKKKKNCIIDWQGYKTTPSQIQYNSILTSSPISRISLQTPIFLPFIPQKEEEKKKGNKRKREEKKKSESLACARVRRLVLRLSISNYTLAWIDATYNGKDQSKKYIIQYIMMQSVFLW